jgi:hypothetical protein
MEIPVHMPAHEEVGELLRQGYSPAAIAKRMGISPSHAVQHLFAEVDRGRLSISDILFAISEEVAREVEALLTHYNIHDRWTLQRVLRQKKFTFEIDDALLYYDLRRAPLGDIRESRLLDAPSLGVLQSIIRQGETTMSALDVLRTEIDAIKASVTSVATSVESVATRVHRLIEILESAPTKAEIEAMAADLEINVKQPILAAKAALDAISPLPAAPLEPPLAEPPEPPTTAPLEPTALATM